RHNAPPSWRKWQFSLRVALLFVLGLSIVLAIASQWPRWSAFAVSMTLLLFFPLALAALLRAPLGGWGLIADEPAARCGRVVNAVARPLRWLGLWPSKQPPSLVAGLRTALISTAVLVGLWPVLREVGSVVSILSRQPIASYTYTWSDAARSMESAF